VQVGIEPTGRAPESLGSAAPDTVKWSSPIVYEAYDNWFRLEVDAQAEGERVAVYLRGNPEWPVKHNDSYWDDARLEVLYATPLAHQAFVPLALARYARPPAPAPGAVPSDDPVPPDADIRIEYPIRAYPDQENFWLPTCDDLEFESVLIANHGLVDVNVAGWELLDRAGNSYVFGPIWILPGDRVRVWSKPGPDTTHHGFADVYWGRAEPVWDGPVSEAPFDEAILVDDQGTEVARRGYP
jgi:hypothetical protein